MPDELLLLLEKVEKEGKGAAPSASALVYVSSYPPYPPFVLHGG